jgi:hypothetical protein
MGLVLSIATQASSEPAATQVLSVSFEQVLSVTVEKSSVQSESTKHATQLPLFELYLGVAALTAAHVSSLVPAATQVLYDEHVVLPPEQSSTLVHATQADPFHAGRAPEQSAFILIRASMLAL